jgi:TonB family protein
VPPAVAAPAPPAAAPAPAARLPLVGIKRDRPVVTAELLREKQSGLVTVAFDVNPDGSTGNVRVASSTNRKLNSVAMEAVRQWRYQPINDVRPTSVELEFKLD